VDKVLPELENKGEEEEDSEEEETDVMF